MPSVQLPLSPFVIPSGVHIQQPPVRRDAPFAPTPAIPLRALDAETLDALCEDFRAGVFAAAEKEDPMMVIKLDRGLAVPAFRPLTEVLDEFLGGKRPVVRDAVRERQERRSDPPA